MSAIDKLVIALKDQKVDCLLQDFSFDTERQNQMLFFIKPEVFLAPDVDQVETTCRFIESTLSAFGVDVAGGYLMSAETLAANQIMDRHYGYINRVSRTASAFLDPQDQSEIRKLCGVGADTPVFGGHEVLEKHPELSARSLDELWASKKSLKLRSGLYVQAFDLGGQTIAIANGFHPFQLEHFTGSGRKIALLLLNSDLPWRLLRARMLGDTFPEKAMSGSMRGEMQRDPARFGFDAVTIANNCAHMSAGPFEAAFELNNFLSGVDGLAFRLSAIRQARHFETYGLDVPHLEQAITNPVASNAGGPLTSLFDISEEIDAYSATAAYRQFFAA